MVTRKSASKAPAVKTTRTAARAEGKSAATAPRRVAPAAPKKSAVTAPAKAATAAASRAVAKPESRSREAPSGEVRYRWIAHAAYLRAEGRGFAPGQEVDDWLAAEAEFLAAHGLA